MSTYRIKRFETLILKPLSIVFLFTSILFLVQKEWLIGSILIINWFLFGIIGQSLNKAKSIFVLMQGTGFVTKDDPNANQEMSDEEARLIARPLHYSSGILSLTSIILFINYDLKFYFAIPLGLILYPMFMMLFTLISVGYHKKIS